MQQLSNKPGIFSNIPTVADDPIMELFYSYRRDQCKEKIDLGLGVYKDENGKSVVFRAVKEAEK